MFLGLFGVSGALVQGCLMGRGSRLEARTVFWSSKAGGLWVQEPEVLEVGRGFGAGCSQVLRRLGSEGLEALEAFETDGWRSQRTKAGRFWEAARAQGHGSKLERRFGARGFLDSKESEGLKLGMLEGWKAMV
jgi:hypothetical protein